MARPSINLENINAPDPSEVYGSDAEDFDSEESRNSSFSLLSTPTVLSNDTTEEALSERATAQSLAATDGSAHGSPYSGRSVSSPASTPNHDESSNPVEHVNWSLPHFLFSVHVPVLQEINTLLNSNAPMSHNGVEAISSDEDNDEQRRTWHRLGEEQRVKRKHVSTGDSSSAKRTCDGASGSKEGQEEGPTGSDDAEPKVATCSVCLEEIDEGGEHRLVALKCGHPFGESCVKRWLENVKQCCPLCNRHAKAGDIRVVFLDCCRLGSSYELAEARKEASDLRRSSEERGRALLGLEQQVTILRAENRRLNERIRTLEKGLTRSFSPLAAQSSQKSAFPGNNFFTKLSGQCKYMAYGEHLNLVAVSMKPTSGIFEGYGIGLCSLYDLNSRRTCRILHRQEIKDLCFHPSRPWLLTASFDNTARISDVGNMSLNNVQNLQLATKVWSCCWSQRTETNFFLGLANGYINEYDVRNPTDPIHVLRGQTSRLPITSVKSFEIETLGAKVSGIISPQMRNSVSLYREAPQEETGYTAQDIPVPGFCFSLFFEKSSASVLVSTRAQNQTVMNEVWKLALQGSEIVTSCRSNFRSGGSASIISKPIMCQSPSGESWACCLDDRRRTIQVFSSADGSLLHTLETKDPNHEQMTQVERIKLPGLSQFALLGLSLNGLSMYY